MSYRKKHLVMRPIVNWSSPTAEDVAAGLSEQQELALLGGAKIEVQAVSSLQEGVPGWRPPLLLRKTLDRTVFGEAVAQAIEAQRAGTTKIGPVADESAVPERNAP